MAGQWQSGDPGSVHCLVATATAVSIGSLMFQNATTKVVLPASSFTWDTDLATTRAAFVALFAGAAAQVKYANADIYGNQGEGTIRVNTSGNHTFTLTAGTPLVGAFVGVSKASGNALLNDSVEVVATLAQAIGKITKIRPAGVERDSLVEVELLSNAFPKAR